MRYTLLTQKKVISTIRKFGIMMSSLKNKIFKKQAMKNKLKMRKLKLKGETKHRIPKLRISDYLCKNIIKLFQIFRFLPMFLI